jgi:hypothetical protein
MTKKSTKANVQPNAEGGQEAAPELPVRKPRLTADPKTAARTIDARTVPKHAPKPKREPKERQEDMVVFAFRLSPEEREVIHKAAGPARASKFVRAVAIAAACANRKAIDLLLDQVKERVA